MLPHVASAMLARPVEAHGIVGRLVGAQHRADGRVGVAPVLQRQPFEHPVADQGVVRVEGDIAVTMLASRPRRHRLRMTVQRSQRG